MIQTTQLSYAYPGQSAFRFPDVACSRNEHALILGPSGAGKTTLLHLLGGILRPTLGAIRIAETAMHELSDNALDQFRGQKIGIVFQRPHFIRSISALDNILLTQNLSGRKSDSARALQMLKRLNIENKAHHRPYNMSIGEQQRLAIARALINHPEVILADEPSSALDDKNCHDMIRLLLEVASENNASLIVVTHDTRIKDMIPRHIFLN
jgi:putative ABC transport system ATP-binding protein